MVRRWRGRWLWRQFYQVNSAVWHQRSVVWCAWDALKMAIRYVNRYESDKG